MKASLLRADEFPPGGDDGAGEPVRRDDDPDSLKTRLGPIGSRPRRWSNITEADGEG